MKKERERESKKKKDRERLRDRYIERKIIKKREGERGFHTQTILCADITARC